jgi:biotin carboxyl carrier protein
MKRMRVKVNEEWYSVEVGDLYQSPVEVVVDGEPYLIEVGAAAAGDMPTRKPRQQPKQEQPGLRGITQGDERTIRCPLPGVVIAVSVTKGQVLEAGDEICVLNSMKMEQSVRMAKGGTVKNVKIKKDQSVTAGAPLIEIS